MVGESGGYTLASLDTAADQRDQQQSQHCRHVQPEAEVGGSSAAGAAWLTAGAAAPTAPDDV